MGKAQARRTGLVVTPWRSTLQPNGLATLRVTEEGRAEGHFGYPMAFMDVRGQRRSDRSPLHALYSPETWQDSTERATDAELDWLTDDFHARFAAGLMLPGMHAGEERSPAAAPVWWLSTATSWARVAEGRVRRWGPPRPTGRPGAGARPLDAGGAPRAVRVRPHGDS